MELNRRDFLKGIGAAAATAGVAGAAIASAEEAPAEEAEGAEAAADVSYAEFNAFVKSTLRMDCDVIGIKFYENHDDVPAEAVHPKADMGKHMATCQALSLARYNGQTICMSAEDEWCWAPLVGYGIVDCSEGTEAFDTIIQYLNIADMDQAARFYAEEYPRLELGKYAAWVIGPLSTITYEPDVVMVYGDPFAINWLCLNAKHLDGKTIASNFDGIDSCVYEMVNTMTRQDYQICFPDCGEIVRARTKQSDAVFCIPGSKLQQFMNCVMTFGKDQFTYNFEIQYEYPLDYTRPPFYNEVFEMWGLETGEDWALG